MDGWVNNGEAGDMRRYRAHYDVIVMMMAEIFCLEIGTTHYYYYYYHYQPWIALKSHQSILVRLKVS